MDADWPQARTIFLTGASSGIGRETARLLVRDGHRVALCARREEALRSLRAEWPADAPVTVTAADVTRAEELAAAVESAERAIGPLDTLLYSAGAARFRPVDETSDELWRELMEINLDALFRSVRLFLPRFRRIGRGHVVAVLSVASRHAFPGSSAYTAAKFGALGFLESVRAEVRREGIHVTAVLPGATDTPLWDGLGDGWNREQMMRPEQVARVIASALRDTASGMVEEIRILPVGGSL